MNCLPLRVLGLTAGLLLCGCGVAGAFGQAAVTAEDCAGKAECTSAFEGPLAKGASATPKLRFELRGSGAPAYHLESADPLVLEASEGQVTAHEEGLTGLMVLAEDGSVLDFFHVWVRPATALQISGVLPGRQAAQELRTTVELVRGDELRLSTRLLGGGQALSGEAEVQWELEQDAANKSFRILDEGVASERRLVAVGVGSAKLTIKSLGLSRALALSVVDVNSGERAR
jgi:hypothetical protein